MASFEYSSHSIIAAAGQSISNTSILVQLNSASLLQWISIVKQDAIGDLVSSFEDSNCYERGPSGFRESRYYSE